MGEEFAETVRTRHTRVAGSRNARVVLGILATGTRLGGPTQQTPTSPVCQSVERTTHPESLQTTFGVPRPMSRGGPWRVIRCGPHPAEVRHDGLGPCLDTPYRIGE